MRWLRLAGVVLTVMLAFSNPAGATWQVGDVITYQQGEWGADPTGTNAASLLQDNYLVVYTSGRFEIGLPGTSGFSILFTNEDALLTYLPAVGTPGVLTSDLLNPSSSSAGSFGGDVAALKLNIDFADAGLTAGSANVRFGDLTLSNFTLAGLNGITVRQFLGLDNTLLGAGASSYSVSDLDPITADLNVAFFAGTPTTFAQDHLVVPEPGTLLLLGVGVLGLAWSRRRRR